MNSASSSAADYRADLDLIFCNADGSPLKPNSVSATISKLFRTVGIEKPRGKLVSLGKTRQPELNYFSESP